MSEAKRIVLPDAFLQRMERELGTGFHDFEQSFRNEVPVAVRINPGKWKGDRRDHPL